MKSAVVIYIVTVAALAVFTETVGSALLVDAAIIAAITWVAFWVGAWALHQLLFQFSEEYRDNYRLTKLQKELRK